MIAVYVWKTLGIGRSPFCIQYCDMVWKPDSQKPIKVGSSRRPDKTFAVDWALTNNYLSIYGSSRQPGGSKSLAQNKSNRQTCTTNLPKESPYPCGVTKAICSIMLSKLCRQVGGSKCPLLETTASMCSSALLFHQPSPF